MSRLGDLIKLERTRQGLTHKQVAKKCGVSDKYLMEVEAGTRIIGDDQARRILKTIGLKSHTESEFTLEDIAATVDLQSAVPQLQRAAEPKKAEAPKQEPAKKEPEQPQENAADASKKQPSRRSNHRRYRKPKTEGGGNNG